MGPRCLLTVGNDKELLCGGFLNDFKEDIDAKYDIRLGRAVFRTTWNGKEAILKRPPPPLNWRHRIFRFFAGNSLPFLNECHLNSALNTGTLVSLRVPGVLHIHIGRLIVFEALDYETDAHSTPMLGPCEEPLYEFNTFGYSSPLPWVQQALFKWLEAPTYKIVRLALFRKLKWSARLSVLRIVLKSECSQRKLRPVLIHNDLGMANIADVPGVGIVFLDFEDAIVEEKWILVDAVDIEFDRAAWRLNLGNVESYWHRLLSNSESQVDYAAFKRQVRMCLLRLSLFQLNRKGATDVERVHARRFLDTILADTKYDKWFSEQ